MQTGLVEATPQATVDHELLRALDAITVRIPGKPMHIGIRNEQGHVYRWIATSGLHQFVEVVEALIELGFTDELAGITRTPEGFDAIFSRRSAESAPHPALVARKAARAGGLEFD